MTVLRCLILSALLGNVVVCPAEPDTLSRLRKFVPPLTHARGDRLPILLWQPPSLPTGLETGTVEQTQQVYLDRGLMPLCNLCSTPEKAKAYLPVFHYWQQRGFPVCILPQGWMHTLLAPDKNRRSKCPHAPPADPSPQFPCAAATLSVRGATAHADNVARTLGVLKDNGVRLRLLVVDAESGLYLRHSSATDAKVRAQMAMALQCTNCVAQFGRETFAEPARFAALADRVRAQITRSALCEPVRRVFPDADIGNFFAWPIHRLPRPQGLWPAYGFENSGLNVAMPSMYMNAGWNGAGRDQAKMNWNAFRCCLERFSPAASVLRLGELLIPWPHVWLGGTYLYLTMKGRALPEPWTMAEMARHMMLRGAETFAIWWDAPKGDFPPDYPYPQYAAMGQLVYDVIGVQQGYNDTLRFHEFLRRARPMTFAVASPEETAIWSGAQTTEKALLRTIAFPPGQPLTKTVEIFGRKVTLPFGSRGRWFWVYPNGRLEEVL